MRATADRPPPGPDARDPEAVPWLSRKRLARAFAALAGGVGFLVGVTSLIDFVDRQVESPPPAEIEARISDVHLNTVREPYGGYLRSTNQSFPGLTQQERREPGLVFAAAVRFKGSQDEDFVLRASVFDAHSGRPVPGYSFNQSRFTPSGPNHAREWPFWLPYPPRPGVFFVRATLLDPKKQPVDEQDSERFRVERVPPVPG